MQADSGADQLKINAATARYERTRRDSCCETSLQTAKSTPDFNEMIVGLRKGLETFDNRANAHSAVV